MCNMRLHQFEALRQMSSACVLFLGVGVWFLEWEQFRQERAWQRVVEHPHWYLAAGTLNPGTDSARFANVACSCSSRAKI